MDDHFPAFLSPLWLARDSGSAFSSRTGATVSESDWAVTAVSKACCGHFFSLSAGLLGLGERAFPPQAGRRYVVELHNDEDITSSIILEASPMIRRRSRRAHLGVAARAQEIQQISPSIEVGARRLLKEAPMRSVSACARERASLAPGSRRARRRIQRGTFPFSSASRETSSIRRRQKTRQAASIRVRSALAAYSAASTGGATLRESSAISRYRSCHSVGPLEGETCTAVTLYSGQFVAQSELSVVTTLI